MIYSLKQLRFTHITLNVEILLQYLNHMYIWCI